VAARLSELKESQRTGLGETKLVAKRKVAQEKRKQEEAEQTREKKEQITFQDVFTQYMGQAIQDKSINRGHRKPTNG
jgi:hypothetical protein